MRQFRPFVAVVIGLAASWHVAPARAQTIPADQSCGGLLCDVGILGHNVEPAPSPPPPAAPVVAAPAPVAVVPREPQRRRAAVRKAVRPVAAKAAPTPVVAAPAPARVAAAPAPAPVYTGPTMIFQSIDPRFQLDP